MGQAPNIVFIFSDQQHWRAVGFADATFETPNHDRLARESVVFNNAFCTTPQCSPSRSSIMTGLYPSKTGMWGNLRAAGGRPLQMPTIGARLQEAGYRTAYFGKWHLGKDPVGTAGWDEDFGVTGPDTTDDREVTRRALDFIERAAPQAGPFALFLSYNNPHDIYQFNRETNPTPTGEVPLPETWGRKDLAATPAPQRRFMAEDQGRVIVDGEPPAWRRYRELYREKVKLYDNEVGLVMGALQDRGLLESSLVTVTSDHGDMDGHHGLIYKGPFMYEHMMRVPLIIRPPGGAAVASTVEFPSVNVDLAPTLADYAGCPAEETDGVSLKPLITGEGPAPRREFVVGQYYSKQKWVNPIRMIRTARHKYNVYRMHGEELYHLHRDPWELNNAADSGCPARARLREALDRWMAENDDPFPTQAPTTREGRPVAGGDG